MREQASPFLAIIGQGYVGLPLAMAAVDSGWNVIGIDKNQARVAQINSGISPVEDISDSRLLASISAGTYISTCDFSQVANASVVTICVPTPLDELGQPDLGLLKSAAVDLAPYLGSETLVVSESTSYPGTLREIIIPIINSKKSIDASDLYFAAAPERVNPGDKIWDQKNTPRLVGGINHESQIRAVSFYESICDAVVPVSTPEIAEAAKLLENTFRLVNIGLINEFSQICSKANIKIQEVIDAASSKPYGFMPFRPGVGVGGHCIPVDPLYFTWWAKQHGGRAEIVELADSINKAMPKYVAMRALNLISAIVTRPRVLILGIAYKSGVGDVRETPALALLNELKEMGAEVAWHDPFVEIWEGTKSVKLNWKCDLAILATNQPGINLKSIVLKGIPVLDCTNSYRDTQGIIPI